MSVSGLVSSPLSDISASVRRPGPESDATQESGSRRSVPIRDRGPVRSTRPPVAADPVSLPSPKERTEGSERPVEGRRFRRLAGKGLKRLARGVRNELRQLSREIDADRSTRKEIRQSYKEFRTELKSAFRSSREEGSFDADAFASTIRTAFRGLIDEIRGIVAGNQPQAPETPSDPTETTGPIVVTDPTDPVTAATGDGNGSTSNGAIKVVVVAQNSQSGSAPTTEEPTVGSPITQPPADPGSEVGPPIQDPAEPLILRAISFSASFQSIYSRVESNGSSKTSFSFTQTQTQFQFQFSFESVGSQLENVA